jgi:uncharacterized protein (TIGR02145 family)
MSGTTGPRGIIGTQRWMTRNLDVDTYRNGDSIPYVSDPGIWFSLTTGAWRYYNDDPANDVIYGKLYNWYAVNDPRGLAPIGWHVPTETEFNTLRTFLGGSSVAGGPLKAIGTDYWTSPNTGATNRSGFNALGAGYYIDGANIFLKTQTYLWSTTQNSASEGISINLTNTSNSITNSVILKRAGASVRVLKD